MDRRIAKDLRGRPMYAQIFEDLRGRIESGELAHGVQLPTEIELRERYGASRNTVRDALKLLATRGLVQTRAGQGTFVTKKMNPVVTTLTTDPQTGLGGGEGSVYIAEVEASGRTPTLSELRVEMQKADSVVADALRIEEGADLVLRHQQRFVDGTPWSLQSSFYPMRLVRQGALKLIEATEIEEGTVAYLAESCGIRQAGYRDTVAVRPPDDNEAAFFKLPADGRIPVFEIFRVAFDANGDRFRLTITVYASDRNRFVINVGDVPPALGPTQGDGQ